MFGGGGGGGVADCNKHPYLIQLQFCCLQVACGIVLDVVSCVKAEKPAACVRQYRAENRAEILIHEARNRSELHLHFFYLGSSNQDEISCVFSLPPLSSSCVSHHDMGNACSPTRPSCASFYCYDNCSRMVIIKSQSSFEMFRACQKESYHQLCFLAQCAASCL